MWIYKALLCLVLAVNSECRGKGRKSTLQRYVKSDDTRMVCSSCPLAVLVRSSTSRDHCARKCSRNKRSFPCRGFYFENHTGKCYLLPFDRFSNDTLREHKANTDLYERKDYVRDCVLGSGASYRGGRSVTKTNISCQAWSTKYPHEPRREFQQAKRGKDLRENFCRNPDNHSSGPWCYTLDPKIRFESCGLPQCSEECMRCNGEDYRGPMDHTESGKECQRWDSMKPHKHHYLPKKYPDKGLNDNYCRNPDGRERPWCHTMVSNKTWEYCSISECDPGNHTNTDVTTSCFQDQGLSYRGTVNVTSKGVTCQRWDSQFPHNHSYSPQNYKCKDLRENYCRNPDGADLPWCFTTDPNQRLAYCTNIARCQTKTTDPEECYEDNGENYRGNLSKTRSGIPCALWSDHSNRDLHSAVTGEGLEKNLCRNPDRDKHGPWCYTTDPSIPWDYCRLKRCKDKSPRVTHQLSIKPSCFVHITTRIVGGAEVHLAKDGSWVVSIQKGNNHWCGGSLIREEWVLTDQQCFSSCVPDLSEYSVQVGLLHLNSSSLHPRLHIAHVVCGPEGSNLALLKLAQPAPLSEHAFTIQLPVAGCSVMEGTNCLMYGWGETKGTGNEESLKSVSLPMVSNERCSQLHSGSLTITENKVCAGGRKDQGVCDKDYGGPLVCQEQKRKVIVGVSIHGRGCALARRPAVFVNVAFYSEWIHKVFRHYNFERNYY